MKNQNLTEMQNDVFAPSQQLKTARLNLGLSQEEVADMLHIRPDIIRDLEHGDFSKIPNRAFAVGYIRSYAKLVGLPSDDMIRVLDIGLAGSDSTGVRRLAREQISSLTITGPVARTSLFGIVVLVTVVAAVWWQFDGSGNGGILIPVDNSPDLAEIQVAQPGNLSKDQDDSTGQGLSVNDNDTAEGGFEAAALTDEDPGVQAALASEASEVAAADLVSDAGIVRQPRARPEAQEEDAQDQGVMAEVADDPDLVKIDFDIGGDDKIVMRFSDECWVEIAGSNNEAIYSDLHLANEVLTFHGQAPMSVILGNASAVRMTYKDNTIDVDSFANQKRVAKIHLAE